MRNVRLIAIVVIVILQMAFFAGWYVNESDIFKKPIKQIMVKTEPYDPRDLLSGQYLRLTYSFSSLVRQNRREVWGEWDKNISSHNKKMVWVVLREFEGYYEPKSISYKNPETITPGDVLIRGIINGPFVKYGIERYFVPEGTKEPKPEDTTVKLNVYENGLVRIHQVYVHGKEWP